MPLSFGAVCDLLQSLETDLGRKRRQRGSNKIVTDWFASHREQIENGDVDRTAVLSTLLPERRTDRVFNIKHNRLESIITKACGLGKRRQEELTRWRKQGSGVDLAECVENILKDAPNGTECDITVEEVDKVLHQLAAGVDFSSPAVRSSRPAASSNLATSRDHLHPLTHLFRQLSPRDAKWLCRLILKTFLPVVVPEDLVYSQCHPLLPALLNIHDNFAVATTLLEQQIRNSQALGIDLDRADIPRLIKPQVGVKVGRQTWLKARSIQHCLGMGRGVMSCERKMDGEYCQIHIDLSKGDRCIQIFSKSGKDSTRDRIKLHSAIRSSLGLGTAACRFKRRCILEGELVVWSDQEKKILGFEKIRRHVNRCGRFIGIDEDSPPPATERLMIVYFDLLLVDDESMLSSRHSDRRQRLSTLILCEEGRATLVEREVINFSSRLAATELRKAFAACIVEKEEGLVLKPDEPYFNLEMDKRRYASCCLKLKKAYVKNLGDIGDFAVVGARYDPTRAKVLGLPNTKYTHFYLGCIANKAEATRFEEVRPSFIIVAEVELNAAMAEYFKQYVFTKAVPPDENDQLDIELPSGIMQGRRMSAVFLEPAVFDITCFAFHKETNTRFWSPRFPYVSKIHTDRSWKDCLGFDELQDLAETDRMCPEQQDSQELAQWITILEEAESKRRRKAALQDSQSTNGTITTDTTSETWPGHTIMKVGTEPASRQPLGDVTSSPSSQSNALPPAFPSLSGVEKLQDEPGMTDPGPSSPCFSVAASLHSEANTSALAKASKMASSSVASRLDVQPSAREQPTCRHAGENCALAGHFILLAPCVASIPWLTEDLLPSHGVAAVFKDIPSWLASTSLAGSRRRQPRLVLVERRRAAATEAFLTRLQSQPLKGPGGQPEVMVAYDWRLLEAITCEEDARKKRNRHGTRRHRIGTSAHGKDSWRKYYIGLC
ncbi:hypothetical protein M406DRAFT_35612 [Cryphonectria parasitica EP155]|uniref:ATP-dependent DNA ligase family profile domain-containing protein n=1 Tax=Cryphonectria parasitica (strain ATCC 38755 / EP155) TaxID=660469 RepID=A0A9P4YE44_CRYP1|nr:uncharacterized protein M406DRAFT_35612 [Cryphonectria parasitica EP155]KAF3771265.1 hypothetical protein M406DRAFT_35612 [Cryphonectria parasitica EP155]